MKRIALLSFCLVLSLSTSACLKTRAQLRETQDDAAKPIGNAPQPAQVQDVAPAGSYALDEMKTEMTRLNGRIEDLERSRQDASGDKDARKEEIKKLETRIVELEQAQAQLLEAFKKMQDTNVVAAKDPTEAFESGKTNFASQNYDAAIDNMSAYLKSPKAKVHVEEATFIRAESYFALKQYKKAIVDYSKFPEKFSNSRKMPAALLKIGQSFEALGMKDDAKGFYQELVEKYPRSKEAKSVHRLR